MGTQLLFGPAGTPTAPKYSVDLRHCRASANRKQRSSWHCWANNADLQADGWREAAGHYGEEGSYLSVADIVDPESLVKVRASKQAAKAAAKAAKTSGA